MVRKTSVRITDAPIHLEFIYFLKSFAPENVYVFHYAYVFLFFPFQDYMTDTNAQKGNTATSSTYSETQAMISGRRIAIFTCPLNVVVAFLVDTSEAEMDRGPNKGIALIDLSAEGQNEGAAVVRGIVTGGGGAAAGRGGVAAGRGGAVAGRGGVAAEEDTIETRKGEVIVEPEREGCHSNHW